MLKFREIRKAQGLSARQLAEDSGISISTIQAWEREDSRVNKLGDYITLAEVLDCSVYDLIDDDKIRSRFRNTALPANEEPLESELLKALRALSEPSENLNDEVREQVGDLIKGLRALRALI